MLVGLGSYMALFNTVLFDPIINFDAVCRAAAWSAGNFGDWWNE
jgi:hypothetical protein